MPDQDRIDREQERVRDHLGEVFRRMEHHEKECIKMHNEHQRGIERLGEVVAAISRRQTWIIIAVFVVALMEILRDDSFLRSIWHTIDIGIGG